MSAPFGPRLIGETEKTLSALLHRCLAGTDLTEPEWVTLRLADQLNGSVGADGLTAADAIDARERGAGDLVTSSDGRNARGGVRQEIGASMVMRTIVVVVERSGYSRPRPAQQQGAV